jgi:peptidoglycan hydrolase CwlO-like protein
MKKDKIPKLHQVSVFEKVTGFTGSYISILIHTIIFAIFLLLPVFGILDFEKSLLILTTIVSLEAIYLALFIQMTVNRNTQSLENVEEDIQEIQEDVEEISDDVEELAEDVEDIQESQEEMAKDLEEIQEDVEEISESQDEIEKELDELAEDVEDISEEVEETDEEIRIEEARKEEQKNRLEKIENTLELLLREITSLKK